MMTEKRFTIKSQDDYFGISDNNVEDKMNVINGIHTEIEAKWLCDLLNALHEENQDLKKQMKRLYNYFEDFFSEEMENNDFSEMWDFVAEDEKWD